MKDGFFGRSLLVSEDELASPPVFAISLHAQPGGATRTNTIQTGNNQKAGNKLASLNSKRQYNECGDLPTVLALCTRLCVS